MGHGKLTVPVSKQKKRDHCLLPAYSVVWWEDVASCPLAPQSLCSHITILVIEPASGGESHVGLESLELSSCVTLLTMEALKPWPHHLFEAIIMHPAEGYFYFCIV